MAWTSVIIAVPGEQFHERGCGGDLPAQKGSAIGSATDKKNISASTTRKPPSVMIII
jgi:hypothetical protein